MFEDKSAGCGVSYPNEEQTERIFRSLHKDDAVSREINCSACGYDSCSEMVVAIHNGFNNRENCVYYEKEETILLARMSYSDQLTGVMNRNALEMTGGELYGEGHSLGLIVADVNELKRANDTQGHTAGDVLIVSTAKALANRFGKRRVFRTGGDEFLVILQDYTSDEVAEGMASVKQYLQSVGTLVSMGMSYTSNYTGGFEAMQKAADARMYEDKARYYTARSPR